MTRTNFFRTLAALLAAPFAHARRKPDPWATPQGQYVLMLRAELERLGYFDDLKEDWMLVREALMNGCVCYDVLPSRYCQSNHRLLLRIVPMQLEVKRMPSGNDYAYVDPVAWTGGLR